MGSLSPDPRKVKNTRAREQLAAVSSRAFCWRLLDAQEASNHDEN
jgi:hypothetical protein